MAKTRYSPEDISLALERTQRLIESGKTLSEAATILGVSYSTLYQWRRRYADLPEGGVALLRELAAENERLRRSLMELEASRDDPTDT